MDPIIFGLFPVEKKFIPSFNWIFFIVHGNGNNLILLAGGQSTMSELLRMGLCLRALLNYSDKVVIYDFSSFPQSDEFI